MSFLRTSYEFLISLIRISYDILKCPLIGSYLAVAEKRRGTDDHALGDADLLGGVRLFMAVRLVGEAPVRRQRLPLRRRTVLRILRSAQYNNTRLEEN
jgi:hypothetical protein